MGFLSSIPLERIGGLRPRTWICVDTGFSREEIKEFLLRQGQSLISDAVIQPEELCRKILSVPKESVLGSFSRQEILRLLLAEPRISKAMPELKRLRRQSGFFRKLDRALQQGRRAFAHAEELQVHTERLIALGLRRSLRLELQKVASAYEAWLEGFGLWDFPLLLRKATESLREGSLAGVKFPEEILHFSAERPQSSEQEFWGALATHVSVQQVSPLEALSPSPPSPWRWQRWHTLDDAAEALAESLAKSLNEKSVLGSCAILVPDVPSVRRSLKHALEYYGIPVADPRDPTRLRWDESLKWACLPIEVVGRNFERATVISWARSCFPVAELAPVISEINARGIREGLTSYNDGPGGKLEALSLRLHDLARSFGGKKTCKEFGAAHLEYLISRSQGWTTSFFEEFWKEFDEDLARISQADRRAPARYWLERLELRLQEATPPTGKLRPVEGIAIHRLGQVPLHAYSSVWIFGMPEAWLSGEKAGDYWYSEREREVLSSEFQVRSAIQVREERILLLKSWNASSKKLTLMDANYDWDGSERESLLPLLRELGGEIQSEEKGAHPRWVSSYGAKRSVSPLKFELLPLHALGRREIRATEIDHYSRCGFRGLSAGRWRLWDLRDPGTDLWPEVKGNILHRAVKILLETKLKKTPFEALERAWVLERPKGLLQGSRLANHVKGKLLQTLKTFIEKENEYVSRSGARVLSLEGPELRLDYPDFSLIGIPDRIDESPHGIFIVDYKTSSQVPKGTEIAEEGYRLQLPFYALAAQKMLGRPAVGAQFIELNKKGGRSQGILFKQFNGKDPGKLTNSRARLSVLDSEPALIWSKCEEQLLTHAQGYAQGRFEAVPKKESECRLCPFQDLCGHRRVGVEHE